MVLPERKSSGAVDPRGGEGPISEHTLEHTILSEARSRLYRSQSLQMNIRLKALD